MSGRSKAAVVYTDGSCRGNGRDDARAGIGVYWGEGDSRNYSAPLSSGRQTNNRAEIEAATKALDQAKSSGYRDVEIRTDSQFLHNSATKWMDGWKSKGWRTSTGGEVRNRADFERLNDASKGMNVKWEHVRGHSGDPGNQAADNLANQGALNNSGYGDHSSGGYSRGGDCGYGYGSNRY